MRPLGPADAEAAADVLARAFFGDPLWVFLLPNPSLRAALVRQAFRATAPLFTRSGMAYGIGEPLAGVAVWSAPNPSSPALAALLNVNLLTLLASPLTLAFGRAAPIFAQFERLERQYAPQPHYHLNTIGIIRAAQGRGLASKLIRPILARADAEGVSVYTETITPSNVPLYQHFGFAICEQYDVPNTNLSLWSLLRRT
jgi:GNAT superfamily N-acetyltransferase